MNDYLKNVSDIGIVCTGTALSPSSENEEIMFQLPEQPPAVTASSVTDKELQVTQDDAEYLSPQKIRIRKYTLKKG